MSYTVGDLFFSDWKQLSTKAAAEVYMLKNKIDATSPDKEEYGYLLIGLMRHLIKNSKLVDKINEAQVVDCFNELKETFLSKPFYHFPDLKGWQKPDEKMARCSFNQFIFADNEFSTYLALAQKDIDKAQIYLKRLAVTLYKKKPFYKRKAAEPWDKELVADQAERLKAKPHELLLIFFTFSHVREFVVKRCKQLLPATPPSAATDEPNVIVPTGSMWHEIMHAAARTLVFGTFAELGHANMYDVLDHLEKIARDKNAKS
jgi:hypothetical protein